MPRVETNRRVIGGARIDSSTKPYVGRPTSPIPIGRPPPLTTTTYSSPVFERSRPSPPSDFAHSLTDNGDGTYSLEPDEFGSYPGFPSISEYEEIQDNYLKNLSTRKQEKALITQAMYDAIHAVLMDPSNTHFGTPQFRFWVRKMFVLACYQGEYTVTHEEKPVAAKEQIYQILVHCHGECYHGGRDKTCAQIKLYYSWIPKELVAQFVKACPTCVLKRSNNPKKFVAMLKDIGGATGPDDDYIDYFTSPIRTRADQHIGKKKQAPPSLFLDTSRSQSQNSAIYTPGLLEDNTFRIQQQGQRSSAYSSTSPHVPSPMSTLFGSYDNHRTVLDDGGWGVGERRASGSRSMTRPGELSFSGRGLSYGSQHGSSSRSHSFLMAPSMTHSLSEGHQSNLPSLPYPPAPSRMHPSLGNSSMTSQLPSYYQGFSSYQGDLTMSTAQYHLNDQNLGVANRDELDIGGDGSLLVGDHANDPFDFSGPTRSEMLGSRSQVVVKVEGEPAVIPEAEATTEESSAGDGSPTRLRGNFAQRRAAAAASLSLDLAASSFAAYRGEDGLLSSATSAGFALSTPASATDSSFLIPSPNHQLTFPAELLEEATELHLGADGESEDVVEDGDLD